MRKIIRYYQPGVILTLFDSREHKYCREVLYLQPQLGNFSIAALPSLNLPSQKDLLKISSSFCLIVALLGLVFFAFPIALADINYRFPKTIQTQTSKLPPNTYTGNFINPTTGAPYLNNEFKIEIPKIKIDSQIIPNVDATNESQYKKELINGVAHASESYFPGQNGPVFLFAHSTDTISHIEQYNAKFYALRDLEVGDEISIKFRGKIYQYSVSDKKIIGPNELDSIRNSDASLILSTCWPPGTDWQRVLIFAKQVNVRI